MANPGLSDEDCLEAVEAFHKFTTKQDAAISLGLAVSTFKDRLRAAARRGMFTYDPVMPGFQVSKVSTTQDADGNTVRQSIQQKPEDGGPFEVPEGHAVKGLSALIDGQGNIQSQWIKTRAGEQSPEQVAEIIRTAFEGSKFPASCTPETVPDCDDDRLTAYILADWHVGLFAYGKETGGPDWDLSIARRVLMETMREVVEQSPPSKHAIVLGLGDLLHADNSKSQTPNSGNVLDTDTRYSKCLETVVDLVRDACEMIAAKHDCVTVTAKPGNHDSNSTVGITQALRLFYEARERVTVDTSPNPFFWHRFGVNLIGGVHGDKTKLAELPLIMANRRKEDWGEPERATFIQVIYIMIW